MTALRQLTRQGQLAVLLAAVEVILSCSPKVPPVPLSSVTWKNIPAGPSGKVGLATVYIIEAELDLAATGLANRFSVGVRITYVEGKDGRVDGVNPSVDIVGNTAYLRVTLAEKDYWNILAFFEKNPEIRFGLILADGSTFIAAGVLR
jgi:hypothetical protein